MKKTLVAVLALLVVLTIVDASPIAAKRRLVKPLIRLEPMLSTTRGDPQKVDCPGDGTCSSNTTCCLLTSGDYACCQEVSGNCCSDYYHCCASGYVCDMANKQCLQAGPSMEDADEMRKF